MRPQKPPYATPVATAETYSADGVLASAVTAQEPAMQSPVSTSHAGLRMSMCRHVLTLSTVQNLMYVRYAVL